MAWLEQRTRIPLAGIVAIVLIVAVVAIFLRVGLNALLPESSVQVLPEAEEEANVRGSASFVGERDVALEYTERLRGLLVRNGDTLTFSVQVAEGILAISGDGFDEEVALETREDGALHASFEYDGAPSEVLVTPLDRTLTWRPGGQLPILVALKVTGQYEGRFLYDDEMYLFQFLPGEDRALVTGASRRAAVPLSREEDVYYGLWRDGDGASHPVEVRASEMLAVIGELW